MANRSEEFLSLLFPAKAGGAWAAPLGNATSVGRHIGQTFELLVQHLGDHADLLALELAQKSRWPVVGHERLAGRIGVHEHAQRDVESDAVILFEQLLAYCRVADDEKSRLQTETASCPG